MNLNALIYLDSSLETTARMWASRLSLACIDRSSCALNSKTRQQFIHQQCMHTASTCALVLDTNGLALHSARLPTGSVGICADFHGASATYRRIRGGGKGQMIAKAVGIKSGVYPYVLDATAGLGRDAFVLATLGCRVTLLERVACIYALLEDAMKRARRFGASEDIPLLEILDRMELMSVDSLDYMSASSECPDVIYLDPMFPKRTKSAHVKKEMQVFHQLIGFDNDADALLKAALKFAKHRVVVKRPRSAPTLSGPSPSYSLEGKRNRYDVYALRKLPDRSDHG